MVSRKKGIEERYRSGEAGIQLLELTLRNPEKWKKSGAEKG